jgi:hypothetical protein
MRRTGQELRRLWTAIGLLLLLAACSTTRVGSDYDRSAQFGSFHSFALMHREHHGTHNPLVAQRAEDDIKNDLTQKGYAFVEDPARADFTVDFTIGSRERTDVNSYPEPYTWAGWGPGFGGWWGAPYWGDQLDVRQYREGTLSIDMFDARSHRPVWHGWAKKELSNRDLEQPEQPVATAVASVLAKFPPR